MSAAGPRPALLTVAEAVERLARPDAPECFSPLTGPGLLAVDLGAEGGAVSGEALERARPALRSLPAPSVGVRIEPAGRAGEALAYELDVIVEDAASLEAIAARVARQPLACTVLVQLLRQSEGLDVAAGLQAESLAYATLQGGPEFAAWRAAREPAPPRKPESGPAVAVRRELDRLHLRLDRPERHNAYSSEMRDALCEGLALALTDDSIREVILSGEGGSFCSGGDLDEFGALPDPATAHAVRSTRNAARLLAACAQRVRARLHGACIGAGVELPAFAGRVEAREDAFFELPELAMGLVPGAGGTVSLPRRIGRRRTAWLALSGRRIDARRALAWGLVDALWSDPR